MNSDNDKYNEIQRLEKELKKREESVRLRELELEIHKNAKAEEDPPLYEVKKENPPNSLLKRWGKKLGNFATFLGIVVAVAVTVKIAYWLSLAILVGGIGWVYYKMVLNKDDS